VRDEGIRELAEQEKEAHDHEVGQTELKQAGLGDAGRAGLGAHRLDDAVPLAQHRSAQTEAEHGTHQLQETRVLHSVLAKVGVH